VVIVSLLRGDLRDEFKMADEAFALSPIAARAAQPSEEDYDAIREAFMETSRGRWFLSEYAKRNRNADTRMVLDAVARIEENIAAQRQQAAAGELAEALAAIRKAVDEARASASLAVDGLALEQTLTPIRKGARVVREIAWRWREIGTDSRICDLLDSQAGAIEAGCGQIAAIDPKAAMGAAFDLIARRIAEFGDGDTTSPQVAEEAGPRSRSVSPVPSDETPAATPATMPAKAMTPPVAAAGTPAMAAEAAVATEEMELSAEAADAHDEAVLDLIAMEMAAPDPFDTEPDEAQPAMPEPADSRIMDPKAMDRKAVARQPEPAVAAPVIRPSAPPSVKPSPQHSLQPSLEPPPQPAPEPSPEPSLEPSLGSTLIASGILSKPKILGPDPLAPIRRMSQAEKIAFFS
jgi:hypothetical protein